MAAATFGTGEEIALVIKETISGGKSLGGVVDDLIRDDRGSIGGSNPQGLSPAVKKILGNLSNQSDKTAAQAIKARGGGASQVNQLQTGYGQMTLGELATRAAQGDPEAIKAIKMVKQAGSQGKGGK